jgi:hypothetical protein
MRLRIKLGTLTLAAALMLGSCAMSTPTETVERQKQGLTFWKQFFMKFSIELIGRGLNGVALNGEPLEHHIIVGVSLDKVKLGKGPKKNLGLKKTLFRRNSGKGKKLSHRKMIGARFTAYLETGQTLKLRIEDSFKRKDMGVYYSYVVSYKTGAGWLPLCGTTDAGDPVPAIPLVGLWDYQQGVAGGGSWTESDAAFTFACEGYVLAKCITMGYPPWAKGELCDSEGNGNDCVKTTLRSRHQACSRAMRADFCGDGKSYTVDETELNLYDGVGIRVDSEDWLLEAEWDEDGARCAVSERIAALPVPPCLPALDSPDCGDEEHFESGTLLFTEIEAE